MNAEPRLGVLFFHPANVFGGAERTAMNIMRFISRDRIRLVLVAKPEVFAGAPADKCYSLAELGLSEGFETVRKGIADARQLCRVAEREGCSVVVGMLHYGAMVAAACKLFSGFRLWAIASPRTPSYKGIEFHVGTRGRRAWLWRTLVGFFSRVADRVIVASRGLEDECVAEYGARRASVRVIPNGLDPELLGRAADVDSMPRTRHGFQIVTTGRLAPEKDFGTLMRAFARVRESVDASLRIVGAGPELAALEALATTLGVRDHVEFLGFQQEPLAFVKGADLFVHTALFEGFGNVLLEAMACRVAVVATDCDFGPREIIRDGENGRLVRQSDPEHLAEVVTGLLVDASVRDRLARAGFESLKDYSAELMAQRYESVFLEARAACSGFRGGLLASR